MTTLKDPMRFWPLGAAIVLIAVSWGTTAADLKSKAEKTAIELIKKDVERLKQDTDDQKKVIKSVDDRLRNIETNVALIAQAIEKQKDD